ncbi:type IV pilus biogenesis/stability protein PilW [Enterovibrio nigricans]|uniref:Type IV pilus assembly protein PilF n=1 Tax=Enterovibrio nigricans DSM 22720 TaxID=1121868 RepID=A0A1T4URK1_9GAMM|nr:type IV pilus biogenesis/stability protein PilW [Enterovibrio nigricans]PKF50871.1 type IV pilus biogenesis/stability protein PilW [Enterovibrio nigricans]SKA55258.1 type IV pilus assembly protein PilF [Enterovibrio nigricans DSM 22720]
MARTLISLLLMGLLAGCVTVTDEKTQANFDNIQAAESRISLGLAYLKDGNWLRARENLEMAVQFAPRYDRALITFAHYLQEVGEFEQAEAQYKAALRYSPKNGDAHNNYGVFLCKQARFDEAQEAFEDAIAQPNYYKLADSYENAALCALKADDNLDAKQLFQKAIDHEPNRPVSSLRLAQLEIEEGELVQAKLRLFHFHKRYGYQPSSLLAMVKLETLAQQPSEAVRYARILEKKFPESNEYRQYLANEY